MRKIALILLALTLTGCATLEGKIDNRVACTVGKDRAYVVSEYGPIGISSVISQKDAAVICR